MNASRLVQVTLGLEVSVVVFAACAAFGLRLAPTWLILTVTGVVIVLAITAIALAKTLAGRILGSLVPIALLQGGLWLLDLFILGLVFAALWVGCLVLARRLPS